MKYSLSIVVPAYNEEANVTGCINSILAHVKKSKISDYEVIVVNDGSTDKTGELVSKIAKKHSKVKLVTNNPNKGYGGSLKAGFDASTKEFICFIPADNQFDFSEIDKLINMQIKENSDIVSGIRINGGADPLIRKINRWGWNTIVRALFGYLASDIDCGFKLFRRSILESINLTSQRGAMIDTQFLAGARVRGFKVSETPLTHLPRIHGAATGANLKVILHSFVDLFRFWWQLKNEILVEKGIAVFRWELIMVLAILIVGGVSRFWNIKGHMTFLGDEGRDAIVIHELVKGINFPLVGPGTSIGNMNLGPWYYYLIAPAYLIYNSPVSLSVVVGIIGVLTIWLVWWVGRQWFGRAASLAMTFLYAISPLVIYYSRSSWNPNIMPFFSLLSIYSAWKVYKFGYVRWLLVLFISLGFVINSHYLGLILITYCLLIVVLASFKRYPNFKKYLLLSLFAFTVMQAPLVVFDAKWGFRNAKAVSTFFLNRESTLNIKFYKGLPKVQGIDNSIISSLFSIERNGVLLFQGLFWIGVVYSLARINRQKISSELVISLGWIITGILGMSLYKQHIYPHYFGFLFPAYFIVLGFVIKSLSQSNLGKKISILAVLLVSIYLLSNNPLLKSPQNQLQNAFSVANYIKSQADSKPFHLALISKNNYDASYRYALMMLDSSPSSIHADGVGEQLFVICENWNNEPGFCNTIGHPLWEIAAFGWAKVEWETRFPWGAQLFKLTRSL